MASQRYILKRGVEKLDEIRRQDCKASGMVVAKSISHAVQITRILRYECHQDTAVISYPNPNSTESIGIFKVNNPRWVVCVGMPFEGDDTSKLQVCCHLGDVLDEITFRQLLGRVLRKNNELEIQGFGWLYTFVEPVVCGHVEQLQVDIPDMQVNFENVRRVFEIKTNNLSDAQIFFEFDGSHENAGDNSLDESITAQASA